MVSPNLMKVAHVRFLPCNVFEFSYQIISDSLYNNPDIIFIVGQSRIDPSGTPKKHYSIYCE